MSLKEYYKVRDLNLKEIKQAIEDFKNTKPELRDGEKEEWSARVGDKIKNAKNLRFKTFYEGITGRELTPNEIRNNITDFIEPKMFVDLIYPMDCKTESDCIQAIKDGELYWVFYMEEFSTYDIKGNDVNLGDIYIKFDTIKGDIYVVKSLHALGHNKKGEIITDTDIKFIHIYNDFINGKIK